MKRLKGLLYPTSILILSCVFSGCGPETEVIGSSSSSSSGNPNGSSSSSSGNVKPVSCNTSDVPFTPLRRLTRFEYENTVKDLLKTDTSVVHDIPADEADGFDNNSGLQVAAELLVEKYVVISEALAAAAVKNLSALTSCNTATSGELACAKSFAKSFGRRAFRRPLTTDDESMFMAAYDAGARGGSYSEGIELMIRMALQSPNFLYRLETNNTSQSSGSAIAVSPFELATRLSYFIWGTAPDDALLDAAATGKLTSKEQVANKAREMLAAPKAQASVNNFLAQWSGIRKLETITKNTTLFPNYSNGVRDAMKKELPAFVEYMFNNKQLTLENLFTSSDAFVSGPLAGIYGVATPQGSQTTPKRVSLPASQGRAGIFTQAGFLAVQGHPDQTSPVLRGKFVRSKLLCSPPPPPPDNVDISVPEITEAATARERASLHLSAGGNCSGCHKLMDPIGLAFENFDSLGQFREQENGVNIDVSGEILYTDDPALAGEFSGVRPMAEKLANSSLVQECMASQMFRFASGRFEESGDSCSIDSMHEKFAAAGGDIIELMVSMTQTDAFLYRTQEAQ